MTAEFEFRAHSFSRTSSSEPKVLEYVVFSGIGDGEGGEFTGANPDFLSFLDFFDILSMLGFPEEIV